MDTSAIVLNKLLSERNLDVWAKLKLIFLDPAFSSLYSAISKYYDKYSNIPSFEELELTLREGPALKSLAAVKLADQPDISAEVAVAALLDQYSQNEVIKQLDKYIDKLPQYDTAEIKENLASIVLHLDEKILTSEDVVNMADIVIFKSDTDLARDRVHLGFNNTFDAALAGVARQELILVGGKRGAGKSITCSNIFVNQYESGNTSAYFTIEMQAYETLQRNIAILADVDHQHLKQNKLTDDEVLRVVKVRANMFEDAYDLVEDFKKHRNRYKFEATLVKEKTLKKDNQMIIIDDRALTITNLDLHLGKLKARFEDKFKVAVVDYMNQVNLDGTASLFDWQPQVMVSKKLKELARKHDIVIFSPYQIDATGEARFAKGILDAADIALVMEADKEKGLIGFETTKIRGGADMKFASPINWQTLRISPVSVDIPEKEAKIKKVTTKAKEPVAKQDDSAADLPWDA